MRKKATKVSKAKSGLEPLSKAEVGKLIGLTGLDARTVRTWHSGERVREASRMALRRAAKALRMIVPLDERDARPAVSP